jgi:hypothetical protein
MALFKTRSAAVYGIDAHPIDVEVDMFSSGSARDSVMVGMPDTAVRESRERIKSALINSGFGYPNKQITINLAPANIRKEGGGFDLPVALGILGAMGVVRGLDRHILVGELSLDGTIRPVRGALSIAVCAREEGIANLILPAENAAEAAVVEGVAVYGMRHLAEVVALLTRPEEFTPATPNGAGHEAEPAAGRAWSCRNPAGRSAARCANPRRPLRAMPVQISTEHDLNHECRAGQGVNLPRGRIRGPANGATVGPVEDVAGKGWEPKPNNTWSWATDDSGRRWSQVQIMPSTRTSPALSNRVAVRGALHWRSGPATPARFSEYTDQDCVGGQAVGGKLYRDLTLAGQRRRQFDIDLIEPCKLRLWAGA